MEEAGTPQALQPAQPPSASRWPVASLCRGRVAGMAQKFQHPQSRRAESR